MRLDLDTLCQLARPFRQRHAPIEFGKPAYERTVDDAIAAGTFHHLDNEAAAIAGRRSASSKQTAFSRDIRIPAGLMVIDRFAAVSMEAGLALLHKIAPDGPALAKLHEEDDIAKAVFEQNGFVWIDTKVTADSCLRGYYVRGRSTGLLADGSELRLEVHCEQTPHMSHGQYLGKQETPYVLGPTTREKCPLSTSFHHLVERPHIQRKR